MYFVGDRSVGVAIGAGWQAAVAYVNIGCYYLFGIPLGLILGYKVDLGVKVIHSSSFSFSKRDLHEHPEEINTQKWIF